MGISSSINSASYTIHDEEASQPNIPKHLYIIPMLSNRRYEENQPRVINLPMQNEIYQPYRFQTISDEDSYTIRSKKSTPYWGIKNQEIEQQEDQKGYAINLEQ